MVGIEWLVLSAVGIRKAWNDSCRRVGLGYGYKVGIEYVLKWQGVLPPEPFFMISEELRLETMVRSGFPERVEMMISGQNTRSVFDRYHIVSDVDLKAAAAMQQGYLESIVGTISGTMADFGKKIGQPNRLTYRNIWYARPDSNGRPTDSKSGALSS